MIVCVVEETFLRLLSFLWHQTTRVFPCKTSEKEKSSVSFLKSQIFYSIRAANDIFPDSHVFLRFFGGVLLLLLLLLLVLPLISSFLFQARIIPFFHFEGTKDKQSYVASHHPPHRPTIGSSLLFFGNDDNIKRRDLSTSGEKTLNIDTNSYDDSPTEIMWCGWKSRRILIFFLCSSPPYSTRRRRRRQKGMRSLLEYISVSTSFTERSTKNCFLIIFKDFFILLLQHIRRT